MLPPNSKHKFAMSVKNTTTRFQSNSVDETRQFAAQLATAVPTGTTIALNGTLGAGKTHFVQGFAVSLGVPLENVVSPTFVLIQEHHADKTIYHIDAYRVADEDEFLALGVDEYFASDGLVLIEWAERVAGCLPPTYVEVQIVVQGETQREIVVEGKGEELAAVVAGLES